MAISCWEKMNSFNCDLRINLNKYNFLVNDCRERYDVLRKANLGPRNRQFYLKEVFARLDELLNEPIEKTTFDLSQVGAGLYDAQESQESQESQKKNFDLRQIGAGLYDSQESQE